MNAALLRFGKFQPEFGFNDFVRVLHGRTAFTGKRSLCGCYVNMDEYLSTIRVLRESIRGIPA